MPGSGPPIDDLLDAIDTRYAEIWQAEAGLKTYGEAVAEILELRIDEGERFDMTLEEWRAFARRASFSEVRAKADSLGIQRRLGSRAAEDAGRLLPGPGRDRLRDRQVARGGAVRRPAVDGDEDRRPRGRAAIRARRSTPSIRTRCSRYNLSPSFNWDTTGLSDDEMRRFPEELGKLGFVFNFITYGGHQIDGLAAEEFATALRDDGMLALARLQRKFRLLESPYRTPQSLVGGDRLDAALMAASGRTAATKAMGKGSTQHQHLVQTEVPTRLLEGWLATWATNWDRPGETSASSCGHTRAGSDLLELRVLGESGDALANVIFASIVGPSRPEHPLDP